MMFNICQKLFKVQLVHILFTHDFGLSAPTYGNLRKAIVERGTVGSHSM